MEAKWTSAQFHYPTHRSGMLLVHPPFHTLLAILHIFSGVHPQVKFTGIFIIVHLPILSPQVSVIKVKIHEATGMPAGKQKLQYEVSIVVPVFE